MLIRYRFTYVFQTNLPGTSSHNVILVRLENLLVYGTETTALSKHSADFSLTNKVSWTLLFNLRSNRKLNLCKLKWAELTLWIVVSMLMTCLLLISCDWIVTLKRQHSTTKNASSPSRSLHYPNVKPVHTWELVCLKVWRLVINSQKGFAIGLQPGNISVVPRSMHTAQLGLFDYGNHLQNIAEIAMLLLTILIQLCLLPLLLQLLVPLVLSEAIESTTL